jgi:sulfate transport system ATP-binding protein
MEVADRLVVLREGRLEQSGAPRELYERPANPWVMGFLGPVSRVSGRLVRPHDLLLSPRAQSGAHQARIQRVVHLGFEVRVELLLDDGEEAIVQLTRAEAEALGLSAGAVAWVRAPADRLAA